MVINGIKKFFISVAVFLATTYIMYLYSTNSQNFQHISYPLKYQEYVEQYAREFDVDPYLLYAFIKTESSFEPEAVSSAGAIGLTQITEETFSWLKLKLCPKEDIVFEDLYKPDISIRFGAYYISRCLERYNGSIDTAAAAYHSGWGTVDKLLSQQGGEVLTEFPYAQMSNYVYKINKAYQSYQEIYQNKEGV
ncbi:MAG: lytic transglycosylase domain-containing protein [Oscillospiraceae bacterium]|nr:lytic transglycosylase domain-containing protein [Oscillospiraceae bacterium]